jgi:hypothetical protein
MAEACTAWKEIAVSRRSCGASMRDRLTTDPERCSSNTVPLQPTRPYNLQPIQYKPLTIYNLHTPNTYPYNLLQVAVTSN